MSKEQIVGLAVRLFAVFLIVYTLRYSGSVISLASLDSPGFWISALVMLFAFLPVVIAFLLWRFPLSVASALIPKATNREKPKPLSEPEIQVVAFSILGLWLLASAIPDVFYWVIYAYRMETVGFRNVELTPQNIAGIVSTTVELVLGLWLLLGSKGIVGIVRRLRHAGS